jgi:hypothetical protein
MNQLKFKVLEMNSSAAKEWLNFWAHWYDIAEGDDSEYKELIAKRNSLSAEDIRRIGKWKDGVTTDGQWKPNVAKVAYIIWEKAAQELPKAPDEEELTGFLENWSNREYEDVFKSGPIKKHFGLSRATTLLHFISGASYPIVDARVQTAVARLLNGRIWPYTVSSYVDSYVPVLKRLAEQCGTDSRTLDKALFSYGALQEHIFKLTYRQAEAAPGN